jgi:3-methyladenine DNA glycosylase AlkD
MTSEQIIKKLKAKANPKNVAGMRRFGIKGEKMLGVAIPVLRKMAKETGKSHELALAIWQTGIHEARILAGMIEEVEKVSEKQMERWARDFDSWDVCDQVCLNLFDKTAVAYKKALEWSRRKEEFVKRAGFALMAALAVHDKMAKDSKFAKFFPAIKKEARDERVYVKKAVNWALRQIGKRNKALNKKAIVVAQEISKINSKTAKWIATDALRELTGEAVQKRLEPRL